MEYQDVVRDFAWRTQSNLRAIERLRSQGVEVYEATQLVNSMLGLLVFPREEFVDRIPEIPLRRLQEDGWPSPLTREPFAEPEDLRRLIQYLRNAIAHFNIKFLDEEGHISGLLVWNTRSRKKTWEAELRLEGLRIIAERFTNLILEEGR